MYLKLDDPAFRLSEHSDLMPRLPEGIDWSAFTGLDPTPFRTMAANVRAAHAARNTPPQKPLTAPCALRQLVASTRASLAIGLCAEEQYSSSMPLCACDYESNHGVHREAIISKPLWPGQGHTTDP